jgi:hypothetical protein
MWAEQPSRFRHVQTRTEAPLKPARISEVNTNRPAAVAYLQFLYNPKKWTNNHKLQNLLFVI